MEEEYRAELIGHERYLGNARLRKEDRFSCPFCENPVKLWWCKDRPIIDRDHFIIAFCPTENVGFMHEEWWYYKEMQISDMRS